MQLKKNKEEEEEEKEERSREEQGKNIHTKEPHKRLIDSDDIFFLR